MPEDPHFRRTARQPIELSVRYRRDSEGAPYVKAGKLVDLGLGGAQIRCERPPPIDTALRLVLTAPSAWDPLDLPAVVRWVNAEEETFGVAFERLSRAQAAALYDLLRASRFAEGGT
ncbi:MAG: PilZ domain-containing protein [Myxococcales bacterium]|nr:PilZ domain-containing protein [Myxococcales bacterium]